MVSPSLPTGFTVEGGLRDFRIRASLRSIRWATVSACCSVFHGIWGASLIQSVAPPTTNRADPTLSRVIGVGLLGVAIFTLVLLLLFLFGRTEVRVVGDRGGVRTGLWLWQSRRTFDWSKVREIREEGRRVVLAGGNTAFGSFLPGQRRRAVAEALRERLAVRS